MLFNSEPFLFVFLPIVVAGFFGWRTIRAEGMSLWWLLGASILFCGFWNPRNLWVLALSIAMNLVFSRLIERDDRRVVLRVGVAANLALLIAFKYWNFLLSNLALSDPVPIELGNLPIGISFYTFTQIAFLADLAAGRARRSSPRDYSLFVSFFPHLIAGPLFRYDEIVPQFARLRQQVSWTAFAAGLTLFVIGLFKKVAIADHLAGIATPAFQAATTGQIAFGPAWAGSLAYTLQLYFDFSGYSDMAIGLGLMFGIRMPVNFDSPYKAVSIIEFWKRWHITLSRFLRDYLYIPLGGSRRGRAVQLRNIMVVMLLGGLWHGAGWTFILWGGLHGAMLCINHIWRGFAAPRLNARSLVLAKPAYWMLTFLGVCMAWVLFRSPDIVTARTMLGAMISPSGALVGFRPPSIIRDARMGGSSAWILAGFAITLLAPNSQQIVGRLVERGLAMPWVSAIAAALIALLLMVAAFSLDRPSEFIYFQF